jgi:hypothetical protein
MLKIERVSDGPDAILRLSGRMESDHLGELCAQFHISAQRIVLDMEEVTLVDREVVRFLGVCEKKGIRLRNCPPYILVWILKEKEEGAV